MSYNTEEIRHGHISKHYSKRENKIILLVITGKNGKNGIILL